jgi:hypothetical protein
VGFSLMWRAASPASSALPLLRSCSPASTGILEAEHFLHPETPQRCLGTSMSLQAVQVPCRLAKFDCQYLKPRKRGNYFIFLFAAYVPQHDGDGVVLVQAPFPRILLDIRPLRLGVWAPSARGRENGASAQRGQSSLPIRGWAKEKSFDDISLQKWMVSSCLGPRRTSAAGRFSACGAVGPICGVLRRGVDGAAVGKANGLAKEAAGTGFAATSPLL